MGDMHPHDLHKLVRSWLLAEDPYGASPRMEPTMPDMRAPAVGQAAVEGALQPPSPDQGSRNPRAQFRGTEAVRSELAPELAPPPMTEMQRLQMAGALGDAQGRLAGPVVNSEAFQGSRSPVAQSQGEGAVDRALNPPTGSGGGFWMPGEGAETASAAGQAAVERALATKKKARSRLKDPRSETDVPPE